MVLFHFVLKFKSKNNVISLSVMCSVNVTLMDYNTPMLSAKIDFEFCDHNVHITELATFPLKCADAERINTVT